MLQKLLSFLLVLWSGTAAFSQTITGTVTDAQTGKPLRYANVSLSGTLRGSASNGNGTFTISDVPPGEYTLRVNQVGYGLLEQPVIVSADAETTVLLALQPAVIQLNKVVVVTAQRAAQKQFERPEAIAVLTQDRLLQNAPRSTPEALIGTTGVFMQKTNHGGGSPFIRGLTGQQTLILIDGIRLNNATFRSGPNQYLNTIDPQSIEQIEVVRGAGSVQYGSDALGGVVQLLTKEPQFSGVGSRFSGSVYGKYMSAGMEKSGRVEAGFSGANVAVLGGFALRDFGDLVAGGNIGTQKPTGYQQLSGDIKAKFRLGNRHLFTAAYQLVNQDEVPQYFQIQLEDYQYNYFDPQQRQLTYARLESFYDNKWIQHVQLTGSLQQFREGRSLKKNNSPTERNERDETDTWGATLLVHSAPTANWSFHSGVEWYADHVSSRRTDVDLETGEAAPKRGLYPDGSTAQNIAVFSLHTLTVNKLTLSAGGRFNAFNITVKENVLGESTIRPSTLVGNLAASYAVHPNHRLVASVSSAFRAPNVDDLGTLGIVDGRYETPNTSLSPEKSLSMEVGVKSRTERFAGSLAVYRNNLTNIIGRVRQGTDSVQGYPLYLKENIAEAYIQGVEADVEVQLADKLAAYANLTYTYGQNKSADEPFRRIPPLHGRVALQYQQQAIRARVEWLVAGKQDRLAQGDVDDIRIPDGGTPGWHLFNVNAGYFHRHFILSAELHNIFNEAYKTHGSGIYGYGRSAWISAKIQF